MAGKPRSIELLAAEVRARRETQLRHLESLDARAGVVLGFAGALVALARGAAAPAAIAARFIAAAAALMALWAFLPRGYPEADPAALREHYEAADPAVTQGMLMDSDVEMWLAGSEVVKVKAVRLTVSIGLLAGAVAVLAFEGVIQ